MLALLFLLVFLGAGLTPSHAAAHVSEGALVLLLPTDHYIQGGAWAVALTVAALALAPARFSKAIFERRAGVTVGRIALADAVSLASTALFAALIAAGLLGTRDPLLNPLPLMIWTVLWMALVTAQALLGDLWRAVNPWTGLYAAVVGDRPAPYALPERLGTWPATVGLMLFAGFAFADPAPDDPARLAGVAATYWLATFIGMALFGREAWLSRAEFLTVLMRLFADLSPVRCRDGRLEIGFPSWRLFDRGAVSVSLGVFALAALGVGSFDGLNETFWWLGVIGVNPLEFPGRSAIIPETLTGLLASNLLLVAVFGLSVWLGLRLAAVVQPSTPAFWPLFGVLALAVTPISLGYHLAHYLTSLLIGMQYVVLSASDPLGTGADVLGLGTFYVSTGFFNRLDTVELIFTIQTTAIVIGHVVSVMLAHAMAVRAFATPLSAALSQAPLALFMIAYTFLGLWLLASPKGA